MDRVLFALGGGLMIPVVAQPRVEEPSAFKKGPIEGVVFQSIKPCLDARGWVVEIYREDTMPEENRPAMCSFSQTEPGATRGPHEHAEQSDYLVFAGPGQFTLYLWDVRLDSPTWGHRMKVAVGESNRQAVIVPPGVVHGYKNTGSQPGWVFNLPNQLYAGVGHEQAIDQVEHEDRRGGTYCMD